MNIIMISNGRYSDTLSQALAQAGHHICTLDEYGNKLYSFSNPLNGNPHFKGKQFDSQKLAEAGIASADALLAMTDNDSLNLMVSMIAKEIYRVPHVVARTNHPENGSVYDMMHIDAINPIHAEIGLVKDTLDGNTFSENTNPKKQRSWLHSIS